MRTIRLMLAGLKYATLLALACGCNPSPVDVQGTWAGPAQVGDASVALSFTFDHTSSQGTIAGSMKIQDPVTQTMLPLGAVKGDVSDHSAKLTSSGGLLVTGNFGHDVFVGTAEFPGSGRALLDGGYPIPTVFAHLQLTREK